MSCIFCKIINNEIKASKLWENDNFFSFLDRSPINPGHILLIPKKHFKEVFDLDDDLYIEMFKIIKKISRTFKDITKAKKVGVAIEGLGVPHAHIHLVPIYHGNELNPERAKKATDEELKDMQIKFLELFKNI